MKDSLITPAELARIDRLEANSKFDAEVQWLCKLALRLSRLKPSEAEFPEHLALINQHAVNAYPMRRAEVAAPVEHEFHWTGGPGPVMLLERKLSCETSDAFLLVRPYVRLVAPQSEGTFEQLARYGKLTIRADHAVLSEGSIAEHLVGFDGYGFHRKPFMLMVPALKEKFIFGVGVLGNDNIVTPVEAGIFLPNNTTVTVELSYPLHAGEQLKLSTGLVMARYTTKDCQYWPAPVKVNA